MIKLSDQDVFVHIVAGDRFFSGTCYRCTLKGGLFVVRGRHVALCARCVLDRIDRMDLELGGLPDDIEKLRGEANREVKYQRWREKMSLSVHWNYLWKCHRCKHLMQRYEVRLIPAEEEGPVTHDKICYACYLVYLAGPGRSLLEERRNRKPGDPDGLEEVTVSWK
jgi:hypothetical protein